jgi:hypothetical protein
MTTSWSMRHAEIPQPRLEPQLPKNTSEARAEVKYTRIVYIVL